MEQLARQMLKFVSYRAASSSSSGSIHEFTNKIPTHRLLQPRPPLKWANSLDLENGIERAIEEVVLANGALANEVCFCNELLHHSTNQRTGMEKANERKMASKKTGLRLEHKYLIWFINLTPTPLSISDTGSGSHWCVLLVDFTRTNDTLGHGESLRVSEVHKTFSTSKDVLNVNARVRFFDPMGGSMPNAVRQTLNNLLTEQLVGNLVRVNFENYASKLTDQTRIDLHLFWYNMGEVGSDSGISSQWRLQSDGVQCGIWCIWFVHQFMLHGVLQINQWFLPPTPTNQVANQLLFRRWYFVESVEPQKQATQEGGGKKRMRPSADGTSTKEAIGVESSDDEAHPAAATAAVDLISSEEDEAPPKKTTDEEAIAHSVAADDDSSMTNAQRRRLRIQQSRANRQRAKLASTVATRSEADAEAVDLMSSDDDGVPKKKMRPIRRVPH